MPNVDDHGLEVLKKAARDWGLENNQGAKKDYALQVYVLNPTTGNGGSMIGERAAVTVAPLQVGLWVGVPLLNINSIINVDILEDTGRDSVLIEWRLVNNYQNLEIKSNISKTFVAQVTGFNL